MKRVTKPDSNPRFKPAESPEEKENQMISLAMNLAEQQLRDGTASSQVITHYLKLADSKSRKENEKLEEEIKLLKAKTENLESMKRIEDLYSEAIASFKEYSGSSYED